MGTRRYHRSWNYYARYAGSQRQALTTMFGGIDRDVERLFLQLPREDLEELFKFYEESHGKPAASYARRTYSKWRNGHVRMSGAVAERLLILLPPLLSYAQRHELVKKLRDAHFRKIIRHVRATPGGWREALEPVVREVVEHGKTAYISSAAKDRVAWLAGGDVAIAERLMHEAQQEEAKILLAYVPAEFQRIEALIAGMGSMHTSVSHTIELPQGTIMVHIETPRRSVWQRFKNWLGQ